jgi:hypothetical protein
MPPVHRRVVRGVMMAARAAAMGEYSSPQSRMTQPIFAIDLCKADNIDEAPLQPTLNAADDQALVAIFSHLPHRRHQPDEHARKH